MEKDFIARASVTVAAPSGDVWEALVNPDMIRQYMFGTNVISDWKEGGQIRWKGEWQGNTYEDKGTILRMITGEIIQYSHYSPLSGLADKAENYHTVTISLSETIAGTRITLLQDHNLSEKEREHSEANWYMMLNALKAFIEKDPSKEGQ